MRRWIPIVICLSLLTAATAGADDSALLNRGIEAYWSADFELAIDSLASVDGAQLGDEQRKQLHKFRALCAIASNRAIEAHQEFLDLLLIDPTFELDSNDVAPRVLKEFREAQFLALEQAYSQGRNQYLVGNFGEAARAFDTALRIDPLNAHARAFLELTRGQGGTPSVD